MKKRRECYYSALVAIALFGAGLKAQAGVTATDLGITAPPSVLGGWTMTAFPVDNVNPVYPNSYLDVTSVPGPGGTKITFDQALTHSLAGDINTGWETWSHGYTGDVYDTIGADDPFSVKITLPSSTHAFYLYAEPTPYAVYTIGAVAPDGSLIEVDVQGQGGANGYGFYTDASTTLAWLEVYSPPANRADFAIGEFGISTGPHDAPDGGSTLALAMLGLLGLYSMKSRLHNNN